MRLPWPFGRRTPSEGLPSATVEAGHPGVRPADPGPSPTTPTGAWAALPPIQRTVGAAPLVAPSAPFLGDVPGHRPLPPILQPLGHEVGPSAPPGLVVAHARPVPSLTSDTPMPTRPVQRRALAHDEPGVWADPEPDVESVATSSAWATPPGPADAPPVRRVAAVPAAATASPPARPLTRTTTLAPLGRPVVARSAAAEATSPGRSGAQDVASAAQSAAPRTIAATSSPAPDLALGPRRGASERPSAADRAPMGSAGSAGARRPGLGAPIPAAPSSAVPATAAAVQRMPIHSPVRPHTSAAAALDARTAALGESKDAAGHDVPTGSAPAARLPILPVARRRTDGASSSAAPPSLAPATSATTAGHLPSGAATAAVRAASTAGPGRTVRPTMGRRPIDASIAPRRDPGPASTSDAGLPLGPGTAAEPPVAARWGAGEALPDMVVSRSVAGATSAQPVAQLSPLTPATTTPGAAGMAGVPNEIVFPPRDDEVGRPASGMDAARTEATFARRSEGSSARMPAAGGSVVGGAGAVAPAYRPVGPLTLARSVAASPADASPQGAGRSEAPVIARIVADPATPSAPPVIQTSTTRDTGGTPVAAITATPIVQRADGAAPPPPSSSDGHSDTELDDLARALFGRIRTHLRAEVIHEREAKGLTFDAF